MVPIHSLCGKEADSIHRSLRRCVDDILFNEPYYANTHAGALYDVILLYMFRSTSCGIVDNIAEYPWLHHAVSTIIQRALGEKPTDEVRILD